MFSFFFWNTISILKLILVIINNLIPGMLSNRAFTAGTAYNESVQQKNPIIMNEFFISFKYNKWVK